MTSAPTPPLLDYIPTGRRPRLRASAPRLLTTADVGDLLQCSAGTVRDLVRTGALYGRMQGRRVLFTEQDVTDYINAMPPAPSEAPTVQVARRTRSSTWYPPTSAVQLGKLGPPGPASHIMRALKMTDLALYRKVRAGTMDLQDACDRVGLTGEKATKLLYPSHTYN